MKKLVPFSLLAGSLLAGCASSLKVSEIRNDLPAGSTVEGIPFRVPSRYKLQVYERTDAGYKLVHSEPVTLPNPDRLFVLGFESQPLANSTVDFKFNPDNTLQQVALKSDSKGDEALAEVGTQIKAVQTAVNAERTADQAATTAESSRAIAADKLKQAADLAELELENLLKDSSATSEAILKAQNKARSAKLDANEAARLAGRSPYFPDVVP